MIKMQNTTLGDIIREAKELQEQSDGLLEVDDIEEAAASAHIPPHPLNFGNMNYVPAVFDNPHIVADKKFFPLSDAQKNAAQALLDFSKVEGYCNSPSDTQSTSSHIIKSLHILENSEEDNPFAKKFFEDYPEMKAVLRQNGKPILTSALLFRNLNEFIKNNPEYSRLADKYLIKNLPLAKRKPMEKEENKTKAPRKIIQLRHDSIVGPSAVVFLGVGDPNKRYKKELETRTKLKVQAADGAKDFNGRDHELIKVLIKFLQCYDQFERVVFKIVDKAPHPRLKIIPVIEEFLRENKEILETIAPYYKDKSYHMVDEALTEKDEKL